MDSSLDLVRHVARLARLELTPEEETTFGRQLGQIVEYVEQVQAVDTSGLEPTSHCMPLVNVVRADEPSPGLARQELLANAPRAEAGMFRVPKIL